MHMASLYYSHPQYQVHWPVFDAARAVDNIGISQRDANPCDIAIGSNLSAIIFLESHPVMPSSLPFLGRQALIKTPFTVFCKCKNCSGRAVIWTQFKLSFYSGQTLLLVCLLSLCLHTSII